MENKYSSLFKPVKIGNLELKNRLVVPPIGTLFCGFDGHICGRVIDFHRARAKGGWGLIIFEGVAVELRGKGGPRQYGIWDDTFIPEYKDLVNAVHANDAKIALQIMHSGRNTSPEINGGEQPVAPSAIADPIIRVEPKELSKIEISGIVESFAKAALRAKEAGFDAVEVHGGHGYLISEFMSGYANKREDEYGGSIEGFARFPQEIIKGIKEAVGDDYPVFFRISANEGVKDGRDVKGSIELLKIIIKEGVDAVHASVGIYESSFLTMASAYLEKGFNVDAASSIKENVNVPVIAVGRIHSPDLAEDIISTGKADMIAVGRQSVADPDWPIKVKENRIQDIVSCLSCNEGCLGRAWNVKSISCVQNPAAGREDEYANIKKTKNRKKVLVVGGGPAGLEAARTAALYGHDVILYEKNGQLGGKVLLASLPDHKKIYGNVIISRERDLLSSGGKIELGKEVTRDVVEKISPGVLIIATGSKPVIPDIPGIDNDNVVTAIEVLKGAAVGQKAVIIGGGIVGCETAELLAGEGKNVTIIEMERHIAKDISPAARVFLFKFLKENNVKIIASSTVKKIKDDGLVIVTGDKEEMLTKFDNIIIAVGAKPDEGLYSQVSDLVDDIYIIGDAEKPGKILQAVLRASDVARSL